MISKELEAKAVDVQFKLASAGEKLASALATPVVDEASVLQQIDQVLAFEREVKRAEFGRHGQRFANTRNTFRPRDDWPSRPAQAMV